MAFSNTVTDIENIGNGRIREYGTWDGTGVTTGTITADTSGNHSAGGVQIADIEKWGFASNGDTQVRAARDLNPNQVKITFASGDAGNYWIEGKAR